MTTKTRNIIMALTLVAVIAMGSVCAYFTDAESAINKFTVGNVDITLTEPNYKEENATNLYAGATVAKDPIVTNVGVNDAYVYLRVQVPKAKVVTAEVNGTKKEAAVQELFTYAVHENWKLLETVTSGADYNVYVYGYKTKLAKNGATEALFTQVTLVNLVEGQIAAGTELKVLVDAYAIQSDNTGTMEEAWMKYCKQNP